ncbi:ABC transporter permease subunit [Granulosicoccus antarcticus]|uniref:Glutamine transport system permease protein GlnP n=1 Tax=Granulosicoccus antarcticus IMCC3135 TaxID=1192854 RepID=A0A2Z2NNU9_9GAMM|nr:ABC transporter permease subunit [Granulosicoccus antarcticus]ASJ73152.1 Glutamine transport system permease protein GlnP [Granulosicoccus antarcticus IMCC3135]
MVTSIALSVRHKKLLIQFLLLAGTIVLGWSALNNARTNLDALGITSGFAFLDRATGLGYSFSLVPRSIDDSYARTLFIGFMNTLFVGFISIFLSTILGFAIGSLRGSSKLGLQALSSVYVQIFRNIPLILQLVFWYSVLIHLPGPRQAYSFMDAVFLSNRGLLLPMLNIPIWLALGLILVSLLLGFMLIRRKTALLRGLMIWTFSCVALFALASVIMTPAGESSVSVPALKGLRFQGGLTISVELVAMIVAIVLYGSAYIAEVVRGGLEGVPVNLVEAGKALGLNRRVIWSDIKMPLALRSIIPPLGNQWIFIMKATTIGVAIGFSDLFMLVSTSITQSGQTLELIGILMGGFLLVNFSLAQFINWLNQHIALKAH